MVTKELPMCARHAFSKIKLEKYVIIPFADRMMDNKSASDIIRRLI